MFFNYVGTKSIWKWTFYHMNYILNTFLNHFPFIDEFVHTTGNLYISVDISVLLSRYHDLVDLFLYICSFKPGLECSFEFTFT